MNGKLALITLGLVLVAASAFACHFDSECGPTGRCVNALCLQTVECTRNLDCLRRGLYFECSNGHCITSKHKICRSNDDCKKNILHRSCINDRCT
ncbi:hypothetical protein TYRP_011164 [Tyrophagus putrescentiae]|nr:hypothetical protein TYRP_011164 [Tyrophagus putrescentiae]